MFCSNCGKEVRDETLFCSDCGKPVHPGPMILSGGQGRWVRPDETLIATFDRRKVQLKTRFGVTYDDGTRIKNMKVPTVLLTDRRLVFLNNQDNLYQGLHSWVYDPSLIQILDQEYATYQKQATDISSEGRKTGRLGYWGKVVTGKTEISTPDSASDVATRVEVRSIKVGRRLFGSHYLRFEIEATWPKPYLEMIKNMGSDNPGAITKLLGGALAGLARGGMKITKQQANLSLDEEMVNQVYQVIANKITVPAQG